MNKTTQPYCQSRSCTCSMVLSLLWYLIMHSAK